MDKVFVFILMIVLIVPLVLLATIQEEEVKVDVASVSAPVETKPPAPAPTYRYTCSDIKSMVRGGDYKPTNDKKHWGLNSVRAYEKDGGNCKIIVRWMGNVFLYVEESYIIDRNGVVQEGEMEYDV